MQLRSYSAAHRKERQEGPCDLSPSNSVRSTMLSSEADQSSPRPPQKARFGNYCLSLKLKGQDGPSAPGHRSSAAREGGTWTGAAAQRRAQRAGRTGAAHRTDALRPSRASRAAVASSSCAVSLPLSPAPPARDCPSGSDPAFLFSCPPAVNVKPPARETTPGAQSSLFHT